MVHPKGNININYCNHRKEIALSILSAMVNKKEKEKKGKKQDSKKGGAAKDKDRV